MTDLTAELFYSSAWQEVTAYEQEGWKYKVGPSDITGLEPNTLELTLANDDLSMDPSNFSSPLYGLIGPNTPARLVRYEVGSQTMNDPFTRTVASGWGSAPTGQAWTTAGGSASDFSVNGSVGRMSLGSINVSRRATLTGALDGGDAQVLITIPVDPTGDDIETSIMIHYQDASNYMQASIFWDRLNRPIELQFVRRVAGVSTTVGITHLETNPLGASLTCWLRAQWFGNHMRMKVWPAADTQPETWTLAVADSTWSEGQIGLRANLQPNFASGVPQVVTFDNFTLGIFSGQVVSTGEASSWKPETSAEHSPSVRGRSWTGLTADGIQRRIGRWEESSISPLTRQISSYGSSLLGFWPLEDPAGASNLTNRVTATQANTGGPGYFTQIVNLADDDGSAGALQALTMGTGGRIGGRFIFDATTDGYQISWKMKLDQAPGAAPFIAFFQWSDTMQRSWYWRVSSAGFEVAVYDEFSALIDMLSPIPTSGIDLTDWVSFRIKVSVSGSTVTYEPAWYAQDAGNVVGSTGSFTNVSVGYPIAWASATNTYTDGAAFSHVFATSDTTLDLINGYDALNAFNAYNGETSAARFVRLMGENNLSYRYHGSNPLAAYMGRQPKASLLEILQDIQVTEAGLIYDDPDRNRFVLRLNNDLVTQEPALELVKGTNLGYPLKKVIDDQRAANDLTTINWDGTSVQLVKETGARSVLAPPDGVGRYPGRLEVSLRLSSALAQRGSWELENNTLDRPRYPTVIVDLLAHPELVETVGGLRPGDLLTLEGEEPDLIYLLIVQIERAGNNIRDTASLTCVPADIYSAVGTYDDLLHRYPALSSFTSAAMTTTSNSLAVSNIGPLEPWDTAGGYDVVVTGERMTVSSATTQALSGGTYNQTLTVIRSINGVVKAHGTDEQVQVYLPGRYSLGLREPY